MMDCDGFIDEIRVRPEIWSAKNPDRKNKFKVTKRWAEIKNIYPDMTVDDLKKRWKNLKDTYRKELKRQPHTRSGAPVENLKPSWRYFELLDFLRDELIIQGKEADDGNSTKSSIQQGAENFQSVSKTCQSPVASPESSKSEDVAEKPSKVKKKIPAKIREEFLNIEKKKMKILEEEIAKSNKYANSENYHFLMSLLPEMDKLPPVQKMRLRTKISQAVLEEVSIVALAYNDQPSYAEVEIQDPVQTIHVIKEESINMYE